MDLRQNFRKLLFRLKNRKPFLFKQDEQIANLEKSIIAQSFLWDYQGYCQKYGHEDMSEVQALDYWYNTGWRKGESPSKYINLETCRCSFNNVNPIIAYMNAKPVFFPDYKNNFKSDDDEIKIQEYLEYKKLRKADGVVYTCITDDYDSLDEIKTYYYVDKNWDYVCFCDNSEYIEKGQVGIWKIFPLQYKNSDNVRNNRWHKLHPHLLFKEYSESIYIDSNINILTDKLFSKIKSKNKDILLPEHFERNCVYDEYERVLKRRLDNKSIVNKEKNLLLKSGMPRNYGLTENNIIYRKHNKQDIIKLMEDWWEMIIKYSKRDQLSLMYVLWENGYENISEITINNVRTEWQDYYLFGHKRG